MISIHHFLAGICTLLLLMPDSANAQIYKWVDAKGQTHYSEKKEDAGKAQAAEVKVQLPPPSPPGSSARLPDWREQEKEFQKRQAKKPAERAATSSTKTRQDGINIMDESTQAKCVLARSIMDGTAKRRNGVATDKHDLDVAKNDVQMFCR